MQFQHRAFELAPKNCFHPSPYSKADTAVESILKAAAQDAPEETPLRLSAYQLLGALQTRQALPLLRQHLKQLKAQDDKWRKIRDEAREDFTDKETEAWKKRIHTAQPASYWFFDLAYAMARIDPEETGLDLLTDDIADVRNGAATGLGEVGTVQLVQRLHNMRLHNTAPLVRHALYRAIDHILTRLEATGSQDDVAALRALLPQVQEREEVSTRVEWTILQLERLYTDASSRNAHHQN